MLATTTHIVLLICNYRAESDKEKTIQKAKKRVVSDSESEKVIVPWVFMLNLKHKTFVYEKRKQEQASKIIVRTVLPLFLHI